MLLNDDYSTHAHTVLVAKVTQSCVFVLCRALIRFPDVKVPPFQCRIL